MQWHLNRIVGTSGAADIYDDEDDNDDRSYFDGRQAATTLQCNSSEIFRWPSFLLRVRYWRELK